jgi:hypothetical protein
MFPLYLVKRLPRALGSNNAWFDVAGTFTRFWLDRTGNTIVLEGDRIFLGANSPIAWNSGGD